MAQLKPSPSAAPMTRLEVEQHADSQHHADGQAQDEHARHHPPQAHVHNGLPPCAIVDVPRLEGENTKVISPFNL